MEQDESESQLKYDVVFQNKAIENILGYDNLPKDMHTPSLLLRNKMYSLVSMTTMSE